MTPIPIDSFQPTAATRLGYIHLSVVELEETLGTQLHDDEDDLGELKYLPMRLASGGIFVLVRYVHAEGGVELWGESTLDIDEVALALRLPRSMIERTGE